MSSPLHSISSTIPLGAYWVTGGRPRVVPHVKESVRAALPYDNSFTNNLMSCRILSSRRKIIANVLGSLRRTQRTAVIGGFMHTMELTNDFYFGNR